MNEAQFQTKLLRELRKHPALKEAVIWKLSDRFTRGIPDVLVSLDGVTTYFELKCWPNTPTKIQLYYLNKLYPRAYVVTRLANSQIVFTYAFTVPENSPGSSPLEFWEALEVIISRCINA